MQNTNVELLTIQEIQNILKISRTKMYQLINNNEIPIIKFGKVIRIDKKDFINWLENQKVLCNSSNIISNNEEVII